MAYRQAEEYYNRRYGPTAVQHHTRYQAPQPAAPSNSHNSGGSFHHNNQRPPPLGGSRRRERAPSFPFSEPHSARSPSYGSGLPVVETHVIPPVPLFCDSGRDHVGHVEGSNYWSDNRFRQETDIRLQRLQPFPRERFLEQHQNFYSPREEPRAGFRFDSRLTSGPQESFHNDIEWNDSGFSVGGREPSIPRPLMQVGRQVGGEVTRLTGQTGFDNMSWGPETGSGDMFFGHTHQWPGDGLRNVESSMGREMDWQTEHSSANFNPQHGFDSIDFSVDHGSQMHREPLLEQYPEDLRTEPSFDPQLQGRNQEKYSPRHQQPPPHQKKSSGGGRGRRRGGRSAQPPGHSGVSRTVSKSPHRPPSAKRESRSGDRSKEGAKKMDKKQPPVTKSQNRKLKQGRRVVAKNAKRRQPSPITIRERLGPHIPGSGSVQNRLGPPKKGIAGVHSRLGPEDNSAATRDTMHSTGLKTENEIYSSESLQWPEDNLDSPHLPSTSVHCRLGPEEINISPPSSHSLLEVPNVSESFSPSTSVHSRLGPNTNLLTSSAALSGGLEMSDPLSSESVHYRLGPKEIDTDHLGSVLSGELEISDPLSSEHIHSRLDTGRLSSDTLSGGRLESFPSEHRLEVNTDHLSSSALPESHLYSRLSSKDINVSISSPLSRLDISDPLCSEHRLDTGRLSSDMLSGGLDISTPRSSEHVHSHLGVKDINDPLGSCTLSGGLEISDSLPSERVHSRLRPADDNLNSSHNSLSMVGLSEVDNHPLHSSFHSRLGHEEHFDSPLYSDSTSSHFRPDDPVSESLGTQSLYSRLGPEQSFISEDIRFRLSSEASSLERGSLNPEPMYLSNTLGDFSYNSQTPQQTEKLSSFKPDDLSLNSSTLGSIIEKSSQLDQFQSRFPVSQGMSDNGAAVDDSYVVIDDAANSQLNFSESSDGHVGRDFQSDKEGFSCRQFPSAIDREFDERPSFSYTPQNSTPTQATPQHTDTRMEFSMQLHDPRKRTSQSTSIDKTKTAPSRDFSSKQTTKLRDPGNRKNQPSSTSQAKDTKRAPTRRARRRRKSGNAQPVKEVVGKSIPTILKQKLVPPPPKKHKPSNAKRRPEAKSSLRSSLCSYTAPMPTLGYKDASSDEGRKTSNRGTANSLSKGKGSASGVIEPQKNEATEKGSVGSTVDVVEKQSNPQGKVGVAAVVRAEREMEEGELTDSECEDLVIDLDTSASSLPPSTSDREQYPEHVKTVSVEPPTRSVATDSATASKSRDCGPKCEEMQTLPTTEPSETEAARNCDTDQEMAIVDEYENQTVTQGFPQQANHTTEELISTTLPSVEGASMASEKPTAEATLTCDSSPTEYSPCPSTDAPGRSGHFHEEEEGLMQELSVVEMCIPNSSNGSEDVVTSVSLQPSIASTTPTGTSQPMTPTLPFTEAGTTELPCQPVNRVAPSKPTEPAEPIDEITSNLEPVSVTAHDGVVQTENERLNKSEDTENTNQSLLPGDSRDSESVLPKDESDSKAVEEIKTEKQKTTDDDIETISISSGEIVSSSPPSPSDHVASKDTGKVDDSHEKSSVSRKEPERRGHRYFERGPLSHRDTYSHWSTRPPIRDPWHLHGRRSGPALSEKWRSKSRSPAPVRRRRHSSRWRRCSSPEEIALRQRRSPNRRTGRVRTYDDSWKRRKTIDGGERYGRPRRTRASRSCDRMSDRGNSESSDEDLEVLELRKEALLSMLTDSTGTQGAKSSNSNDKVSSAEVKAITDAKTESEVANTKESEISKWQGEDLAEVVGAESAPEVSEEAVTKGKEDGKMEDLDVEEAKKKTPPVEIAAVQEEESAEDKRNETCTLSAPAESREAVTKTEQKGDEPQSPKSSEQHSLSSQLSTSKSFASSSSRQLSVKHGVKARVVTSQSAGKRITAVGKSAVGSRMGSPSSSCGSPAPVLSVESGGSGTETPQRGSDARPPPTSVKIFPGSKGTWEIPEFHIQLAESDDEGSESESVASGEGVKNVHRVPTMDEIDSILGAFRREAEAKARSKEKVVSSPDRSPLHVEESRRSPEIVPPRVDLDALGMLPLQRQREYLELKTRLALHAKKQREEEMAIKAKDKGKRPLNAGPSKKAVLPQSEQVKSIETHPQRSQSAPTLDSSAVARIKQLRRDTKKKEEELRKLKREEEQREEQRKKEEEERKRREEELRKEEEQRKKREEHRKKEERKRREKMEREKQMFEKRKKKCEMKIAELEGKIRSCRSQSEQWTKTLTDQTSSLAECESEVEEHELKIELLTEQLELAKSSRDKCKKRKTVLQNEVQLTRESISRHAVVIQDTQQLLIRERELLINMESGNNSNGTDSETVSMEIDSDGSKGEEEMEIVTSSDEECGKTDSSPSLAPLAYETISDSDESPIQPNTGGPSVSDAVSRGKGKRRRMSRSQRTRKSSLSVTHTAPSTASDSETETSKTRKQVVLAPPIPTSPPPRTPPPPPNAPSPSLSSSPCSLLTLAARTLASATPTTSPLTLTISNAGESKTHASSEECSSNTLSKTEGGLVFSTTLPIPPIDVEFLTDTDTASESGLPCSTPLVSSRDPMLSGIGSDDAPTSEGMGFVGTVRPPPSFESKTLKTDPILPEIEGSTVASSACVLPELSDPTLTGSLGLAESLETRLSLPLPVSLDNAGTNTTGVAPSGIEQSSSAFGNHSLTPNNEGEFSDSLVQWCVESEACSSALDSSPIPNNPFISMLKISKIESLSESSDTFSPIPKSADLFRAMSPDLEIMDVTPCPDESNTPTETKASNSADSSKAKFLRKKTALLPKGGKMIGHKEKSPNTLVSLLTGRNTEGLERKSSERAATLPTRGNRTEFEKERVGSLPREITPEERSQKYEIESVGTDSPMRKPMEQAVFIAVIDPDPVLNKSSSPTVSQQRKRIRKKKEAAVEKREVLPKARPGFGGRVEKPTRRKVGRLLLSRCGSDTIKTARNKRKSTPRKLFVPTTAWSSPTFASNSPTSLLMASPTLNRALQTTLANALVPALENALCPRSPRNLARLNRDTVSRSPDLSPTLNRTLQRTLDQALSPVLESVLSPSSFRRQMGCVWVASESTVHCEGKQASGSSQGSHDHGVSAGQQASGSSQGSHDHGGSAGQQASGSSQGSHDHGERAGQQASGSSQGSHDHGGSAGQQASGSSQGSHDHGERSCDSVPTESNEECENERASVSVSLSNSPPMTPEAFSPDQRGVEVSSGVTLRAAAKRYFARKSTARAPSREQPGSSRRPFARKSAAGAVRAGAASPKRAFARKSTGGVVRTTPSKARSSKRHFARKSTTGTSEGASQLKAKSNVHPQPSGTVGTSSKPVAKAQTSTEHTTSSVDVFLGKIKEVKSNLEKQKTRGTTVIRGTPASKQEVTSKQSQIAQQTLSLARSQSLAQAKQVQKAGELSVTKNVAIEVEVGSENRLAQVCSRMDDVVKRLGFTVTWNELQEHLKSSEHQLQVVPTCIGASLLTVNPLQACQPETVSESVMESALNQSTQTYSAGDTAENSLRRFRPYSSPLLSLSSYRLNPSYRTHAKLPLSSLSHSNKIDPMKIWCKFEFFGKCSDPQCTQQHFRDITLSKSELVDDIVSYSPTLSSDTTAVSRTSKTTAKASVVKSSTKKQSYGESLVEIYSGKVSDEQLLVLAAHHVNKARTGGEESGVLTMEELSARETDVAKEASEKTRPPPLYWQGGVQSYTQFLPATAPTTESSSKPERYFTVSSTHKATPTNPTDSAHFLSLAKGEKDATEACKHLELGLALHPNSQNLWVEYLEMQGRILTGVPDFQNKRTELVDRALQSCPTYPVVAKCVQLCATVSEKGSCIVKGYRALAKNADSVPSFSLSCVELLLSHSYLHCVSGHMTRAVTTLEHSLGLMEHGVSVCGDEAISESLFSGISSHLSPSHLQLVYLSLIHIIYTSIFPLHLFLSSPSSPSLLLSLKKDMTTVFIPWSKNRNPSEEVLHKIEALLTSGMSRCLYPKSSSHCPPQSEEDTAFPLQYNLVVFQLVHRSQETAQQLLSKLLSLSPHSARLWMLAAQFEDWTSNSAMVLQVLEKAKEGELDSSAAEFYCCAVKLIMKQGADGSHGDLLTAALPWLRSCVCRYYDISVENVHQLSLADTALLYRKLLGQLVPYDYCTPSRIRSEEDKETLPYLWVAYCLLVQLSHHNLRGNYHHTEPEEAYESGIHSVNRPSHLRIVWLEYLTFLRQNVERRKNSQTAFKAFSDCVYRCLVVMDTKQAPPTSLTGQSMNYHDHTFQEQVCELFFSTLAPGSKFTLSILERLVLKIPDSPHFITRFVQHCLNHSHPSLPSAQTLLANYLAANPHCPDLWRLAIQVELEMRNKREARWMCREAMKHNPLSATLWKEFLLFELSQVPNQSSLPSSPPHLAQEVVTNALNLGVKLTHTQNSKPTTLPAPSSVNLDL